MAFGALIFKAFSFFKFLYVLSYENAQDQVQEFNFILYETNGFG